MKAIYEELDFGKTYYKGFLGRSATSKTLNVRLLCTVSEVYRYGRIIYKNLKYSNCYVLLSIPTDRFLQNYLRTNDPVLKILVETIHLQESHPGHNRFTAWINDSIKVYLD